MKLELKHLAGYLPYELRVLNKDIGGSYILSVGLIEQTIDFPEVFKPILRPLSDLTKEIEVNREKFVPLLTVNHNGLVFTLNNQFKIEGAYYDVIEMPFDFVQQLQEWHFDIYGLIDAGLAIDINTL
jgi:hypothetical protein